MAEVAVAPPSRAFRVRRARLKTISGALDLLLRDGNGTLIAGDTPSMPNGSDLRSSRTGARQWQRPRLVEQGWPCGRLRVDEKKIALRVSGQIGPCDGSIRKVEHLDGMNSVRG